MRAVMRSYMHVCVCGMDVRLACMRMPTFGYVRACNNNIIISFISYITVQQQDEVCKQNTKSTIMLWTTIKLHGC